MGIVTQNTAFSSSKPRPAFQNTSVKKSDLDKRLNPVKPEIKHIKTNIPSLDAHLGGGLSPGLSIVWGEAGTGKSLLCHQLAINHPGRVLYFTCEVLNDSPDHNKYPHVDTVDYTTYRPKYDKAVEQLLAAIQFYSPGLIIIDSLTSFLGVTNKAISEASIRDAVWSIHLKTERACPIVGISEVRGTGYNRTTAGGEGVKHGCTMLMQTYKHFLSNERYLEGFPGHEIGDLVYTLEVQKDKHGVANPRPVECRYDGESYEIMNRFEQDGTRHE